jgi:IS5 family transposase
MRPNSPDSVDKSSDLFRHRLDNIIDLRHELVKLAERIDWSALDEKFGVHYSDEGRPGLSIRLMIGLHILKHTYNLSDEEVCNRWRENPYYQYFTGETYFQHTAPIERSSMTHFRKRVGEESLKLLLQESLRVAYATGALRIKDTERVAVDTTVQPKAVTYPTDAKLMKKAIEKLGEAAKDAGISLRQSYICVAKTAAMMSGRYRHAKQIKRAKREERKLRTWLGRLLRDVQRKKGESSEALEAVLTKAQQAWLQQKHGKKTMLSWHAPEVECIGKGKVGTPWEFGCKVTITTNVNPAPGGQFVLHAEALHGRPYDGHTLNDAISGTTAMVGKEPARIYVDLGYRGHNYEHKTHVYKSRQKRGITPAIKRELSRRTVIEPTIGHIKNDGRMARNYLLGTEGDKINAVLAAAGFNFRQLLRWIRKLFCALSFLCSNNLFASIKISPRIINPC